MTARSEMVIFDEVNIYDRYLCTCMHTYVLHTYKLIYTHSLTHTYIHTLINVYEINDIPFLKKTKVLKNLLPAVMGVS